MKECPVCKETFSEDMYFCDLDGTPLDSGGESHVRGGSSRLWSTLGIIALLGAVVISAVAIVFFPRGFAPAASVSTAQTRDSGGGLHSTAAPAQDTGAAPDSSSASSAPSADDNSNSARLDRNGNVDSMAKLAAKRAQLLKNQNGDSSLPNPKAAFDSTPDASGAQATDDPSKLRPRASKADPVDAVPDVKPAAVKSTDSGDKADTDAAAAAKRKSSKASSSSDKNGNANKKKGGFLKMFKKIFG